jgi:hypothetical protein
MNGVEDAVQATTLSAMGGDRDGRQRHDNDDDDEGLRAHTANPDSVGLNGT